MKKLIFGVFLSAVVALVSTLLFAQTNKTPKENNETNSTKVMSVEEYMKNANEEYEKRPKDDYGITIFDPTDW